MKKLAILGSGDLGQQIANFAISDGHYGDVIFFDDFTKEKQVNGHEVLGKSNDIENHFEKATFNELIIGIGYKHLDKRAEFYDFFSKLVPFGKIVHSSCWVDDSAKIRPGTVIYPNCCIDAFALVKENSVVNISSTIAHDTSIGRNCFLSPGVVIAGFVNIDSNCIIGINSTVIDNIKISSGIQLGGATVVTKDLTKKGLYVGSPARFIR